jgi:hypothetical protein
MCSKHVPRLRICGNDTSTPQYVFMERFILAVQMSAITPACEGLQSFMRQKNMVMSPVAKTNSNFAVIE